MSFPETYQIGNNFDSVCIGLTKLMHRFAGKEGIKTYCVKGCPDIRDGREHMKNVMVFNGKPYFLDIGKDLVRLKQGEEPMYFGASRSYLQGKYPELLKTLENTFGEFESFNSEYIKELNRKINYNIGIEQGADFSFLGDKNIPLKERFEKLISMGDKMFANGNRIGFVERVLGITLKFRKIAPFEFANKQLKDCVSVIALKDGKQKHYYMLRENGDKYLSVELSNLQEIIRCEDLIIPKERLTSKSRIKGIKPLQILDSL